MNDLVLETCLRLGLRAGFGPDVPPFYVVATGHEYRPPPKLRREFERARKRVAKAQAK